MWRSKGNSRYRGTIPNPHPDDFAPPRSAAPAAAMSAEVPRSSGAQQSREPRALNDKRKWSPDEDERLLRAVRKFERDVLKGKIGPTTPEIKWRHILAEARLGRTVPSIRSRLRNLQGPKVATPLRSTWARWTEEEDKVLLRCMREYDARPEKGESGERQRHVLRIDRIRSMAKLNRSFDSIQNRCRLLQQRHSNAGDLGAEGSTPHAGREEVPLGEVAAAAAAESGAAARSASSAKRLRRTPQMAAKVASSPGSSGRRRSSKEDGAPAQKAASDATAGGKEGGLASGQRARKPAVSSDGAHDLLAPEAKRTIREKGCKEEEAEEEEEKEDLATGNPSKRPRTQRASALGPPIKEEAPCDDAVVCVDGAAAADDEALLARGGARAARRPPAAGGSEIAAKTGRAAIAAMSTKEVVQWLESEACEIHGMEEVMQGNSINGEILIELTEQELVTDFGFTKYQVRRLNNAIRSHKG